MHGGKKSRISSVDIVRFACAIGIMLHHFFFFYWVDEANLGTQPRLRGGYIIVEIFLILAGFFAAKHFEKTRPKNQKDKTIEARFKVSVKYTLNKFKGFLPYVIIAVILGLIYSLISQNFNLQNVFNELEKLPQELLLDSGNTNYFVRNMHVAPLWYLSHLFFVFPIFCTLVTSEKKYLRNWLYFIFLSVYYSIDFSGSYVGYNGMTRIFAGLAAGQLLYDFVNYIKAKKIKTSTRILLQFVEVFCIYYIINKLLCRGDIFRPASKSSNTYNFILAAWTGLSLLLAEKTYSHKINSKFISFFGQLAFPLYLVHVPITFIIHHLTGGNMNFWTELALSSTASIIFAIIVYKIVTALTKKK